MWAYNSYNFIDDYIFCFNKTILYMPDVNIGVIMQLRGA